MSIYRGSTPITAIYRGSTPIKNIYRGSTLVWSADTINLKRDDFDCPNSPELGSSWVDQGPSTDYKLGYVDGRARVVIPDGQVAVSLRTSYARYAAAINSADDGFVECRPATFGDSASLTSLLGYNTGVYGRVSNSGFASGVGINMNAGHLWIVYRALGLDLLVSDCGTFQPGDILRLVMTGRLYTLLRNGLQVGSWNDTLSLSAVGSANRSLGIRGDGAKDLFGPRRFSPALDYVWMG
ncbi:MAG: hypothetical protein JOY78_13795 [Pseudonocardia sp.]|nr:hypothetical protein [Pseudonocardia sp.]